MAVKNNVFKLYIIMFFHNLIPAYVIERLFWQERGMTVQMVIYAEIIYAITVIVLEIPSGVIADMVGRKKLLIVDGVLTIFEFFLLIFANQFWHFGLVVLLSGIGKACTSGAHNALLYDTLSADGRQGQFERILGRLRAIDFFAAMLAALSGGLAAYYFGYVFNYAVSVVSSVVAVMMIVSLKEPLRAGSDEGTEEFGALVILKYAYSFFKKNTNVLAVVLNVVVVVACFNYVDEFWQVYLDGIGFPVALFGFAAALLTVARIPGAVVSGWLLNFFKPKSIMLTATLLIGLGIIATGLKNVFGIAGMTLSCFASGLMEPVSMGYLHHRADERARATIESFSSLIESGFVIVIGLGFGYVSSNTSIFSGFRLIGFLCVVISVAFTLIYLKQRKSE